MEDHQIVDLYWQRSESAIEETEQKYGRYLIRIAYNILSDWEDSEETVGDTYLKAWNSMPPHRPGTLSTYLGKITRETAIDRFRKRTSQKRQASQYSYSLSELQECVSAGNTTAQDVDLRLLSQAISAFLRTVSPQARSIFVGRYYFMDSIREVAAYYGMSESKTKSMLHRTRMALKAYLKQEGFDL